jgi:hypothetical protein
VISGEQRLRNIRTKNNLIARRQLRQFLAGQIDHLPCSGDRESEMIAAEFDRLTALAEAKPAPRRKSLHDFMEAGPISSFLSGKRD